MGFVVTREYYINDAGRQIDSLARSAHSRYQEALGKEYNATENEYPGDYLKIVGQKLKEEFGEKLISISDNNNLEKIKEYTLSVMIDQIKKIYQTWVLLWIILFQKAHFIKMVKFKKL